MGEWDTDFSGFLIFTTIVSILAYICAFAECVEKKQRYTIYLVYLGIQFGSLFIAFFISESFLFNLFAIFGLQIAMPILVVLTIILMWGRKGTRKNIAETDELKT